MNEQDSILTTYERESLRKMGQDLQRLSKAYGKLHKKSAETSGVFFAVYKLGVAIERFSALDGHMEIWATFVPDMFARVAHPEEADQLTD